MVDNFSSRFRNLSCVAWDTIPTTSGVRESKPCFLTAKRKILFNLPLLFVENKLSAKTITPSSKQRENNTVLTFNH